MPAKMLKDIRQITTKELIAAGSPDKAWVALHGEVYDVSQFVNRHPGGSEFLLAAVGRDATAAFQSFHEPKALRVLKKWKIGVLVDSDMPSFPPENDFAREVREKVADYFKLIGKDPRDAPWMLLRYALSIAAFLVTYAIMFSPTISQNSTLLPWLAAIGHGWSSAMLGLYLLHDGCHASFTRSPLVWNIMRRLYEVMTGLSSVVWIYQHVLGHHPFTNIADIDPDVTQSDPGLVRVHDSQSWWSYYEWQSYYFLPLYSQLILSRKVTEWKSLFIDRQFKNIRINPLQMSEYVWGAAVFCIFMTHHLIVPYHFLKFSLVRIMLLHTCSDIVWSLYLMLVFQASHVNDDVEWPKPDQNNQLHKDWAVLQVESSMDFAHGDFLTTILTGSLNYQSVHHLFPQISQYYYPEIAPIIRDTCVKYNVTYNIKDTLWEVIVGHVDRLRGMGAESSQKQEPMELKNEKDSVVL